MFYGDFRDAMTVLEVLHEASRWSGRMKNFIQQLHETHELFYLACLERVVGAGRATLLKFRRPPACLSHSPGTKAPSW